ncbi:hypothetical protein H072_3809 [Dactylellina haptotyla CBS 200.50]|uniref:1-phosphatidylinositol-3-phosphate 5-kinase n=1 Tax=Dactylellina haptotyla (strain CBS 200.50) TaxID=1284197 RepID=S8AH06_DACHA|nr:hypothetical protein H072_3809 [Dactylellina haptotyla CBS 200.50]
MERLNQRRPSIDSISSVLLPPSLPIDPAVLDDIHAVAANSPTLTSFALAPSRKKSILVPEQTGLNRIYSLVKGVVGTTKESPDSPPKKSRFDQSGKNDDAASIRSGYSHIEASNDPITSPISAVSPLTAIPPSKRADLAPMSPFQELISPIKGPMRKIAIVDRAISKTPQLEERGRQGREKLYSDVSRANSSKSLISMGQRTPASATFPKSATPYLSHVPFETSNPQAEFDDEQDFGEEQEYGSLAASLKNGSGILVDTQNRQGHSRRESLMSVKSAQYDPLSSKAIDDDIDNDDLDNDPDNDKLSEISTDDDDVIEMGGYLGKVSGLGKALNDKNLEQALSKVEPTATAASAGLSGKEGRRTSTSTSAIQSPIAMAFSQSASRHQYRASIDKTMEIPTEDLMVREIMAEPLPHHPSLQSPLLVSEEIPQEDASQEDTLSVYDGKDTDLQDKTDELTESILDPDEAIRVRKPRFKAPAQHGLLQRGSSSSSVATGTTTTGRGDLGTAEMSRSFGQDGYLRSSQVSSKVFQNEAKVGATLRQLRQGKGLSRDFWMKDENCKECFICQKPFTTFRRKHHCRTCGQIFCSKCTTLVDGDKFGHNGSMRVCINPCLQILENYQDDDSSGTEANYSFKPNRRPTVSGNAPKIQKNGRPMSGVFDPQSTTPKKRPNRMGPRQGGPSMDYDATGGASPSRPSSARSMRRPVSSYNLLQQGQQPGTPVSRHQHTKSMNRWSIFGQLQNPDTHNSEDHRAPFQDPADSFKPSIKDSIIDPELAPYMSDEDADGEDEPMGIFATIAPKFQSPQEDEMMRQITANTNALSVFPAETNGNPSEVKVVKPPNRHRKTVSISAVLPTVGSRMHPLPQGMTYQGHRRRKSGYSMGIQNPLVSQNYLSILQKSNHKQLLMPGNRNSFGALLGAPQLDYGFVKQLKPKIELNPASVEHVKRLLNQMLEAAKIDNIKAWESALLPAIYKCTDEVKPDVRNGESIDLRHFCKIKRIPGGKPSDTHYVSGVVFAKNLALKSMRRSISHPRIAVLAFPVEYHRGHQTHFMSLEPVIAQEKEFLRNMVNRILSLHPTIVLVERDVSGLALDYLKEHNIAVAMRVKPSVIEAVARCAQADIIMSAEETAFRSHRVGKCLSFDVKTYAHKDIATASNRRTYMYFSGCKNDLGCTIVLRGANTRTLAKIKRITEFMVYAVYNMKLETCLMQEQGAIVPNSIAEGSLERSATLRPDKLPERVNTEIANCADAEQEPTATGNIVSPEISEEPAPMDEKAALKECEEPKPGESPPAGLAVDSEKPRSLSQSAKLIPESTEDYPEDLPAPNYYSEYVKEHENKILSVSPFIKFAQPHLLMRARDFERRLEFLKRQIKQTSAEDPEKQDGPADENFELITPEMLHGQFASKSRKMNELVRAVHEAEYDKVLFIYETQKKQWENYLAQNEDLFDPLEHQRIVMLYSMINTDTSIPCLGPEMTLFEYYNDQRDDTEYREKDYFREADCTLGQYIHGLITTRDYLCDTVHDTGCNKQNIKHHRSYVHGDARISVHVEKYKCPTPGEEEEILIWSTCKICTDKPPTKPIRMSDSTWRYSLGKFFEASFWSTGLKTNMDGCTHDLHRDHVRFFGMEDYAVRIEYIPIDLMEVIVPRPKVTWKPELDLKMKNEIYLSMNQKINRYWDTVVQRLKSINIETVTADNLEACKTEIESLLIRAEEERTWLVMKLQEKYTDSRYYEVIPLNRAMRALQERVSDWDNEFTDFYEKFFPSEKDVTRMATAQLKKLFLDRSSTTSSVPTDTESTTTADKESIQSVIIDDGAGVSPTNVRQPSQMSPEHAQEVLTSVVEDNKGHASDEGESRQNSISEQGGNPADSTELKTESEAEKGTEATGRDDSSMHGTSPEPPSSPEMTRANSLSASAQTLPSITDESSVPSPANSSPTLDRHPTPQPSKTGESSEQSLTSPSSGESGQQQEEAKQPKDATDSSAPGNTTGPAPPSAIPVLTKSTSQKRKGPSPIPPGRTTGPYGTGRASTNASTISSTSTTRGLGLTQAMRPTDILRKKSDKGKKLQKAPPEPKPERQKPEKVKISDRMRHVTTTLAGKNRDKPTSLPIPRSHPLSTMNTGPRVSNLAKRFEELSREFQRERENNERRTLANRRSRAFPVVSMKPMVEVFKNIEQAAQEVSDDEIDDVVNVPGLKKMPTPEANKFAKNIDAVQHTKPSPDVQAKTKLESTPEEPKEEQPTAKPDEETVGESSGETRPKTAENEVEASDTEMSLVSDSESSKILSAVAEEVLKVPDVSDEIKAEVEAGLQRSERSSLMRLLTNFWSERSASGWSALEYPLMPSDHVFIDSDVIVREDEPSSLIAFTLGMPAYTQMLSQLRTDAMNSLESSVGTIIHEGTAHHHHEHSNEFDHAVQRSLLRETGTHLRYQFPKGNARMYCKVFFAEQFDALRRNCGVADRFIESLSRCIKWDSKGGKTKSVFLKTLDDRIILKQLSPIETAAFLKFAPSYFHIMSEALFHELPTAIAKMLGFFTIYIKNPNTGTELRWDLLVMENLFYDRTMSRTFDLKGSMRNRYVEETGEQNEVLLDENMVDYIWKNPLFVREHSKKLLRASLWNDTLFLERNQVMDYSLMVGIDDQRKELVIGLIDCVRTYTFDKKIENYIKSTGIAGGGRNKPTITSPKEYKRRFRKAMELYVLEAPNCWRQPRVTWLNPVGIPFAAKKQIEEAQKESV